MARCVLFAEVPGFYAAVARAEDPALAGRPLLVGGDPRKRGRVQAASPEALAAGVQLEMSMLEALRRCPAARVIRTDMARFREASRRLLALLRGPLPRLEPFGLGAAFADVDRDVPETLAEHCIAEVRDGLGVPVRVGIASRKFLARLAASQVPGESGVLRVASGEEAAFLAPLPATRLDGVGRKTAAALAALGATTIGEVAALGRDTLQEALGSHGLRIHQYALGEDGDSVRAARTPKSLSRESTLEAETRDASVLRERLLGLAAELESELRRSALATRRVAVRVRFPDRDTTSRSATLPRPTQSASELGAVAEGLLDRTHAGARPVRSLGIQLSLLEPAGEADRQLELFR